MENLYTVQKTYEALVSPDTEEGKKAMSDDNRIFHSEYEQQMYRAWLTRASIQAAINWLDRPEAQWVADHDVMLNLLKKKLEDKNKIHEATRNESGFVKEKIISFNKEQSEANKIIDSLKDTKSIYISNNWQVSIKWSTPVNPDKAMMKWEKYTTLWWETKDNKRSIYILDNQNNQMTAFFILDKNNTIINQKPSDISAHKNITYIPQIPYMIQTN